MRWWAIAKGPGTNMGTSSPLSILKSAARFWPFSTPLQIWSTFDAAVFCAFSYSVKVNALFMSSLLYHSASMQNQEHKRSFIEHDYAISNNIIIYHIFEFLPNYDYYKINTQTDQEKNLLFLKRSLKLGSRTHILKKGRVNK